LVVAVVIVVAVTALVVASGGTMAAALIPAAIGAGTSATASRRYGAAMAFDEGTHWVADGGSFLTAAGASLFWSAAAFLIGIWGFLWVPRVLHWHLLLAPGLCAALTFGWSYSRSLATAAARLADQEIVVGVWPARRLRIQRSELCSIAAFTSDYPWVEFRDSSGVALVDVKKPLLLESRWRLLAVAADVPFWREVSVPFDVVAGDDRRPTVARLSARVGSGGGSVVETRLVYIPIGSTTTVVMTLDQFPAADVVDVVSAAEIPAGARLASFILRGDSEVFNVGKAVVTA
jgi:hypothetical protein